MTTRAEEKAEQLLPPGYVGGAVNVEQIARERDLLVVYEGLEDAVSGMLIRRPQGKPVIVVNEAHPPARRRFTIAHELGHWCQHPAEGVHVDYRDGRASEGTLRREREANAFAAALLMPRRAVLDCIGRTRLDPFDEDDCRKVGAAAAAFEVSQEAMSWRLKSLGLLPY